ncbi:MAG: hypothetical protein AB8I08_33475 [Sandaracinaceae bacterium]
MLKCTLRLAPLLTWVLTGGFVFAYPAVQAFVMDDLGWRQIGWAFYLFIIPMLGFTLLLGVAATVGVFRMNRSEVHAVVGTALIGLTHLGFALMCFLPAS